MEQRVRGWGDGVCVWAQGGFGGGDERCAARERLQAAVKLLADAYAPQHARIVAGGASLAHAHACWIRIAPAAPCAPHAYFDFVLALGQDEKLLAYVNTLDLFAPVTCTTVDLDKNRGTEAAYFLAQDDVREALDEIVGFRARDLKWNHR